MEVEALPRELKRGRAIDTQSYKQKRRKNSSAGQCENR